VSEGTASAEQPRRWRSHGGAIVVGALFVAFVADGVIRRPEAKRHVAAMREHFVHPIGDVGSAFAPCREAAKAGQAQYACTYRAHVSRESVLAHIKEALSTRGWMLSGCNSSRCTWENAPYRMNFEWHGSGSSGGWDFALTSTWGVS
jgi:hypothetical protein